MKLPNRVRRDSGSTMLSIINDSVLVVHYCYLISVMNAGRFIERMVVGQREVLG